MNRYEIGFIISPEASEEEIKRFTESILATIKKGQGNVEKFDEWGIKKMAYPIQKHKDGYYVFLTVEMDGSTVKAVEKRMRQIEKVIRFITFRLDDKLKKANKLTKKWKKHEQMLRKAREAREESEAQESNDEEEDNAAN